MGSHKVIKNNWEQHIDINAKIECKKFNINNYWTPFTRQVGNPGQLNQLVNKKHMEEEMELCQVPCSKRQAKSTW